MHKEITIKKTVFIPPTCEACIYREISDDWCVITNSKCYRREMRHYRVKRLIDGLKFSFYNLRHTKLNLRSKHERSETN